MLNEVKHLLFPSRQKEQKQILRLRLRMTSQSGLDVGEIESRGAWHTPSVLVRGSFAKE